ncbi:helix-turn-helix domain protein [Clostridium botulinum 202F]|nr:helix-turn-helix domain protein [Clostridium botulinum 202F]KAI3344820.1 hypothetical protein CIT17_15570 [Clostridium botulinum]MBY6988284.1 hypothetical protein [Clostridium botulinum]
MVENKRWETFNLIIDSKGLDIKEKGLVLVIFRYINHKTGYANPSRTLIKILTGISDNRTLDKIFDSLIQKGFLVRESGKGKRSKYFIKVGGEITPSVKNEPSVKITPIVGGEITPIVGGEITPQKEKEKKIKENNIYSSEKDEYRLSLLLKNLILNRDSKARAKKCDLQKWCIHINKLIRLDNRTPEDIERVIKWCQNDIFWSSNILSTEKLRKQFDMLYQQMLTKQTMYNQYKNNKEVLEHGGATRKSHRKSL